MKIRVDMKEVEVPDEETEDQISRHRSDLHDDRVGVFAADDVERAEPDGVGDDVITAISFEDSKYQKYYDKVRLALRTKEAAWDKVWCILLHYCNKGMVSQEDAELFFEWLQDDVNASLAQANCVSNDRAAAALTLVRCWTSAERCPGLNREWCSLLQEVVSQEEDAVMMNSTASAAGPLIQIWATMNAYVVGERGGVKRQNPVAWPSASCPGEEQNILHRGGRLHPAYVSWWQQICRDKIPFRVQRAIATSKQAKVAKKFMNEHSYPAHYDKAYWRYHLQDVADDETPCKHVACLESLTSVAGEQEFLFPPWCSFSGMSMTWIVQGSYWQIDVQVEEDNRARHLDDVATCSWA